MKSFDVIVIGSGISGLFFALKTAQASPATKIGLFTKSTLSGGNTWYAQGGIACVNNFEVDNFQKHLANYYRLNQ